MFQSLDVALWVMVLYGLLFVQDALLLFFCLFLSVFVIVVGQLSKQYWLDVLTSTFRVQDKNITRLEYHSTIIGHTLFIDPTAVAVSFQVVVNLIILFGFYRLYTMFSKRKDFA